MLHGTTMTPVALRQYSIKNLAWDAGAVHAYNMAFLVKVGIYVMA